VLVSAIHQLFLGTTDQRSSYFYKSFSQQAQPNKAEAIQKFLLQLGGDDIILWFLLYRSREGAGSSQLLAQGAIRGVCRALRNTSHSNLWIGSWPKRRLNPKTRIAKFISNKV